MSPRTPEQFEEMRESRRLQIMGTALKLFALEGYGHASISRLASEAGISKGLMYNYFESKEALLGAIIEHGMSQIMDLFDPDHDGVLKAEEMEGFIRTIFDAVRNHQEYWILFISVLLQPNVKEHLIDNPMVLSMQKFMAMLLQYFENRGFEDPALEMITFSAMIEGFGVLLIYAYPIYDFPEELMTRYENRIIEMYTR
ncbi:MAG: TetR/AcrR family transcriptional regulator [Bacteroidales bacterium]|nr:TetR/AcrR family transcriptional regulator [Bacteroidales bacterium]